MSKSSRTDVFVIQNCILSYPNLFKPSIPQGATEAKFSCALLVDEATAQLVYAKAQEVAAQAFVNGETNLQKFKWPVKRAADVQKNDGTFVYRDDPRTANLYLVNANASVDYPPQVVDQNRQPVVDRGQIYAGCIVAAGIQLFTFNTAGNIGVGVGLSAVMKTGDGPALAGGTINAENLFAGVQAQPAAAPAGLPGGAPAPQAAPVQTPSPDMPAAPFGQPDKPPFL